MRAREDTGHQLSAPSAVLTQSLDIDDASLAKRARRGDQLAFAALVERYEKVLYNLSLRMLGDRDDACDATQNSLVKAYGALSRYDEKRRFYSWLYRIAVNECLDRLQRRSKHTELDEEAPSPMSGPHENFARTELRLKIRRALRRLSATDRTVIILRHYLDRSYRAMSEILDLPEKTVKSRLYTARQRLAGELVSMREERA